MLSLTSKMRTIRRLYRVIADIFDDSTLALLWQSHHRTEGEVGPAHRTSQAHDVHQMIKQQTSDCGQSRLWWRPAGLSFFRLVVRKRRCCRNS
jgi:hypothetical protein